MQLVWWEMDPYIISLLIGGAGLGVMAASGLAHHGHDGGSAHGHGHGHAHGHSGGQAGSHAASNGHHAGHTPGAHGHAHHHGEGGAARVAMSLMSPRFLFSVLLGLGLTGVLLQRALAGPVLLAVAIGGGVIFERALVRPLWDLLMRFASKPALTLESCVTDEATAVTTFDARGQGIVSVELDGQIIQLLATLQSADRAVGGRVRAGARVRIEEVDTAQNRCTVSLL